MEGGNQKQEFKPISIEDVVKGKNPKAAGKIPGFIYRWLTRILHLKELNEIMVEYGHLKGIEFINKSIARLNIKFNVTGYENLPKEGRFLFVSNHPLGGLDGVLLLRYLNENRGSTRTLVNDFLMNITPIREWFVPINKVGVQAREYFEKVEELYQSNDQVLIFPAGLCSRKINGKIVDLKWQKHFIQKSLQYKLDVVPVFFEGKNSNFFYNLAKLRKWLKIKVNIEMMYLSDEMFKHKDKTFNIYFGKPIPYQTFNTTKTAGEWADEVKKITYELSVNSNI